MSDQMTRRTPWISPPGRRAPEEWPTPPIEDIASGPRRRRRFPTGAVLLGVVGAAAIVAGVCTNAHEPAPTKRADAPSVVATTSPRHHSTSPHTPHSGGTHPGTTITGSAS